MPKLAANLTLLFNEHAFLDRFEAAARAGFRCVEFLFPYAFHADHIADRLNRFQLDLVLPDRVGEFQDGVGEAIQYARVLGGRQLNCLVGIRPPSVSEDIARRTLVDNLKFAAQALTAEKIDLLIEPINTFDIPGFYLNRTQQVLDLIADVGADNLCVQYDIYHMQRMDGEVANTLRRHLDAIRHVQLADNPGRNEPGTGEINYQFLFRWLDEIGYGGWVGCEYKPKAGTVEGLGWRSAYKVA